MSQNGKTSLDNSLCSNLFFGGFFCFLIIFDHSNVSFLRGCCSCSFFAVCDSFLYISMLSVLYSFLMTVCLACFSMKRNLNGTLNEKVRTRIESDNDGIMYIVYKKYFRNIRCVIYLFIFLAFFSANIN